MSGPPMYHGPPLTLSTASYEESRWVRTMLREYERSLILSVADRMEEAIGYLESAALDYPELIRRLSAVRAMHEQFKGLAALIPPPPMENVT